MAAIYSDWLMPHCYWNHPLPNNIKERENFHMCSMEVWKTLHISKLKLNLSAFGVWKHIITTDSFFLIFVFWYLPSPSQLKWNIAWQVHLTKLTQESPFQSFIFSLVLHYVKGLAPFGHYIFMTNEIHYFIANKIILQIILRRMSLNHRVLINTLSNKVCLL